MDETTTTATTAMIPVYDEPASMTAQTTGPGGFTLKPRNLDEAMQFAKLMANSDLVPRDYQRKPGNVLIAVQMGAELGVSPMQAIQNISVINGRPSVWGDMLLAIVQGHPHCDGVEESISDDGAMATCTVRRRGWAPTTRTFSMDDAKQAGLLGKRGPWCDYPKRMLQMRARAFAIRDAFADALRGLACREEVEDYKPAASAAGASPVRASVVEQTAVPQPELVKPAAIERMRQRVLELGRDWEKFSAVVTDRHSIALLSQLTQEQAGEWLAYLRRLTPVDRPAEVVETELESAVDADSDSHLSDDEAMARAASAAASHDLAD